MRTDANYEKALGNRTRNIAAQNDAPIYGYAGSLKSYCISSSFKSFYLYFGAYKGFVMFLKSLMPFIINITIN